jgi:hypothetical protein
MAPVKNGASTRTRSSERHRADRVRASAWATGYEAASVKAVVSAESTTVSQT